MSTEQNSLFAVVPAAGFGARMGNEVPKQYLKVGGRAIIEHSILRLLSEDRIQAVSVSVADGDTYWSTLGVSKEARVRKTIGGATRAESVLNGLSALSDIAKPHDWVLVHDAARPCLSSSALTHLINELEHHHSGGLLATPVRDTLKQAQTSLPSTSGTAQVKCTLDRTTIWQAQTPQMFRFGLLEQALAGALEKGVVITDEASAMEWAGHDVLLVVGEQQNLKVTTPDDLKLAEALLQSAD